MTYPRIILASASPRRLELVGKLIDDFAVEISECAEDAVGSPEHVVLQQGYDKALDVFGRNRDALVIGADTVVAIDGEILGKPRDRKDARRMLRMLSGREHRVLTGMCVVAPEFCRVRLDSTRVRFKQLDADAIEKYIATGEPMDKAGAYGIQGLDGAFVSGCEGNFDNVMGLCTPALAELLAEFGIPVKQ